MVFAQGGTINPLAPTRKSTLKGGKAPTKMNLSRVRITPTILIMASAMFTVVHGAAADNEHSRRSLRGISGVYVLVEPMPDEEKRDGLNEQDIRTDVELGLRLAGVKVLTKKESLETPGRPYLFVAVDTILRDSLYAFDIEVSLYQDVLLERDQSIGLVDAAPTHKTPNPLDAPTWSTGRVGTVGKDKLSQIRSLIKDHVDTFLNAYLSVNPKK